MIFVIFTKSCCKATANNFQVLHLKTILCTFSNSAQKIQAEKSPYRRKLKIFLNLGRFTVDHGILLKIAKTAKSAVFALCVDAVRTHRAISDTVGIHFKCVEQFSAIF